VSDFDSVFTGISSKESQFPCVKSVSIKSFKGSFSDIAWIRNRVVSDLIIGSVESAIKWMLESEEHVCSEHR
jgi:hypothetical protein